MDPDGSEWEAERGRRGGGGGGKSRDNKIDVDDPLRGGEFKPDAWALLQKKRGRGAAEEKDYELVDQLGPPTEQRAGGSAAVGGGPSDARAEMAMLEERLRADKRARKEKKVQLSTSLYPCLRVCGPVCLCVCVSVFSCAFRQRCEEGDDGVCAHARKETKGTRNETFVRACACV